MTCHASQPPCGPSDAEIEDLVGSRVVRRQVHRSASLSTIEIVGLASDGGAETEAILKTTRPALSHEPVVYRLLEGYPASPVHLIGTGVTLAGDPWLLLTRIREVRDIEPDEATAELALSALAEVHRGYYGETEELSDIPRWDIDWIASQSSSTCEILDSLIRSSKLPTLSRSTLGVYKEQLAVLRESTANLERTVVHGDFDPGNLIATEHGIGAIDWGLSHINTPLIDLAHMVERFAPEVRKRLAGAYLEGLPLEPRMSAGEAIRLGGLIHRAFFIWWHTTVIEKEWAAAKNYVEVLQTRIAEVAAPTAGSGAGWPRLRSDDLRADAPSA